MSIRCATAARAGNAGTGMRTSILWGTLAPPHLPCGPEDQAIQLESVHPLPGGSVFLILTLPPESVFAAADFDPVAAAAEQRAATPGIADRLIPIIHSVPQHGTL
jgi:hypothetical protein